MADICFVSTLHSVHDHRFLYKECAALVQAGHNVSFLVPHEADCVINGVRVIARKRFKSKLLRILLSPLTIFKMFRIKADAYHLCNVELLPVGLVAKCISRRRIVYDNHEDFVSFMLMKSYLPRPVAYVCKWLVQLFEGLASRTFDGFVAADPDVAASYPHLPAERSHIFYNVPVLSLFKENPIAWEDRKYDAVFLGSMSVSSGTLVLLESLAELKHQGRNIRAIFIGQPGFSDIDQRLEAMGLSDVVEITGWIDYDKVPALLDDCRIGLIGLLDLPKFRKNIATKMFEYWAKSMPVVSSDLPPERAFLEHGKHGLLVEPGNPTAFAEAIGQLLDNPQLGREMARTVRRLVETKGYYTERQQEEFADFYAWLLAHPR